MRNIFDSSSLGSSQLLIVIVVLMIFGIAGPMLITGYQFIKFKKMSFEKISLSKPMISIIFSLLSIALILDVIGLVFYYSGSFDINYSVAKSVVIAMIACAASCVVTVYGCLIFANQYVALGINKEFIFVFGDLYQTSKTISLVLDEEVGQICLHVGVGKRVVKRIRFSLSSVAGQCLQASSEILGVEITKGNDKEIYTKEVQIRQEEFRKSVTKNQSQVNAMSSKSKSVEKSEKEKEEKIEN